MVAGSPAIFRLRGVGVAGRTCDSRGMANALAARRRLDGYRIRGNWHAPGSGGSRRILEMEISASGGQGA